MIADFRLLIGWRRTIAFDGPAHGGDLAGVGGLLAFADGGHDGDLFADLLEGGDLGHLPDGLDDGVFVTHRRRVCHGRGRRARRLLDRGVVVCKD